MNPLTKYFQKRLSEEFELLEPGDYLKITDKNSHIVGELIRDEKVIKKNLKEKSGAMARLFSILKTRSIYITSDKDGIKILGSDKKQIFKI